jgi:hypothetical protein
MCMKVPSTTMLSFPTPLAITYSEKKLSRILLGHTVYLYSIVKSFYSLFFFSDGLYLLKTIKEQIECYYVSFRKAAKKFLLINMKLYIYLNDALKCFLREREIHSNFRTVFGK